jgi:uncharacterized protein (DUF1330 family)
MHYLAIGRTDRSPRELAHCRTIADGEIISLEQPWIFGAPLIARVDDGIRIEDLAAQVPAGCNAFVVEGLAEPGAGEAFVFGAHTMRDLQHFRAYADLVPDVVAKFGGRFLARASKVTPIAGNVVPDRVVIIEYPSADTRLVVLARSGPLPESACKVAENYLRSRRSGAR